MTDGMKLRQKFDENVPMYAELTVDALWVPAQQLQHPPFTREKRCVVGFVIKRFDDGRSSHEGEDADREDDALSTTALYFPGMFILVHRSVRNAEEGGKVGSLQNL